MRDAQHAIVRLQLNGVFFDRDAQQQLMETWVAERDLEFATLNWPLSML